VFAVLAIVECNGNNIQMKSLIKNIFTGVGRLFAVFPNTDYSQFIPKQTAAERMRSHWGNTGRHISNAIDRFDHEQSDQK